MARLVRKSASLFLATVTVVTIPSAIAQNSVFSDDARHKAVDLLKQMTLDEKVGQLNESSGMVMPGIADEKPDDLIAKGGVGSILWQMNVPEINRLQHIAMEKSRLHIPIIFGFDVIHGYRTVFPVPLAMASSWDPSVEEQAQRIAAQDARAAGLEWTFTPISRRKARTRKCHGLRKALRRLRRSRGRTRLRLLLRAGRADAECLPRSLPRC